MLKFIVRSLLVSSLIFLTACSEEAKPAAEPSPLVSTAASSSPSQPPSAEPSSAQAEAFKAELAFDIKSAESRLTEDELPSLGVLEQNLTALVQHDHELFRSGFVTGQLADAMEVYYGEQLHYRFSGIESVESFTTPHHQVRFTVLGERLDTTTGTVEDVKLMYAIQESEQAVWTIQTID